MLKRYFIVAITAVFTLVACAEKFDEQGVLPAGSDKVHTLSVGIEAGDYVLADGVTKASMEPTVRVKWEENDAVSVINATKRKILGGCLQATEGGTSVVFEGTVTGTIEENDVLYYIYPRLADNTEEITFDNAGYNQSLANQTYDNDNPLKVCFYGYAKDKATTTSATAEISKKIQFNLVTSYVHLNMANLPAKGFNLSSIDISNVNKGFKWSLSNATLTAEAFGENEGISVNCKNTKITKSGNAVVHFAIPASAAAPSRVLTVNKAYNNANYAKDKREASTYYNQLYTNWESNVSITPQAGKTEVSIGNEGSTEVAEGVLPVAGESASAFTDDKPTEISLGGLGTVTFNQQASAAIKANAVAEGSTSVFFKVEDVTATKPVQNANIVYEVTMKTVDEKGVEVFSTEKAAGVATVTVPLGEEVDEVTNVALVNESGVVIEGGVVPESVHFENGILTFQVNHFSKYAIKYTVKETPANYVAQIGSRKYTTLANAIAAAQNGNTIQMIANHVAPAKIEIGADKNIVLDLNGYTISYSTDKFEAFITNKGSLRITDSSNGKNGKITATHSNLDYSHGCYTIDNFGGDQSADKVSKLVIDAGTIENASTGAGLAWPVNNGSWKSNAELIINGGTIHSVNYVPVREYLHYGGKKTIVINGGKFISDNSRAIAIQVNDATIQDTGSSVTINGGEFTCNGSGIFYVDLHAANANLSGFSMIVNGGKFKNSNTDAPVLAYDYENKDHDSAVLLSKILKGGIYSKGPAANLLADDYAVVANTDEQTKTEYPYTVAPRYPLSIEYPEGVINGYPTIQEALTAAVAFGTQNPDLIPEIHISEDISVSPTHASENYGAIHMVDYGIQNIKGVLIDGTNSESGKSKIIYSPAQNSTYKASGIIKASSGAHVILKNIEFAFTGELIDMANYCIDIVDATVDLYNVKLVDGSYNRIQLNASTNSTAACYNFYEGEYSLNGTIEGKTECFKTWGGTFDTDPSLFLPSEAYVTYKEDNKYKVCLAAEAPSYTASLTSNSKTTNYAGTSGPAAALADAKSGDTVTLLSGTLNTGKNLGALGNTLTIVQNGGTYTGTVTTDASGCVVNAETEGNATVYTVVSDPDADKVAMIVETNEKYGLFEELYNQFQSDSKYNENTIKILKGLTDTPLLQHLSGTSYISSPNSFVLDLNGKTLESVSSNRSPLDFSKIKIMNASEIITIKGDGIVTAESITDDAIISAPYAQSNYTLNIQDGSYSVGENSAKKNVLYLSDGYCTTNIEGGTFTGNVHLGNNTTNIYGGIFNGDFSSESRKSVYLNIYDGTFNGKIDLAGYQKSTITISGGIFEKSITIESEKVVISGGKFKVKPDASYLAPGATCSDTPDEDGYYVVTSSN